MTVFQRRALLTAAATLPAAVALRKSQAAGSMAWPDLSRRGGTPVPPVLFTLPDGTPQGLANYAGKGVVLNLWATWCAPCVEEMPALAQLARLVRDAKLAVLPLSSDRGGAATVERFYRDKGIAGLPVLLDPRGDAARALGVRGLPTTLLIDASGRERGRMEGAVDWASPEAVAAIRKLAE